MTAEQARRRFLLLRGLRWLPTGLLIPVLVLLLLDRGLTLTQVGLVTAVQGAVVLLLELPTGGLADAVGRRAVLLAACAVEVVALGVLVSARSAVAAAGAFALMGVFRALESGPLDAWYVDAAQGADPEADIEGTLARGGVVLGVAIAGGSLLAGGVAALDPLPAVGPLATPLLVGMGLRLVEAVAIAALMAEPPATDALRLRARFRAVPATVAGAVRAVRTSRVLGALLGIELLWGTAMVAFEGFTPPRLADVIGSADTAAALLGPGQALAWLASAAGAALVPRVSRRIGAPAAGTALLLTQAVGTAGIGLLGGPVGVLTAFVGVMLVHGAANPVHQGLLHRAVVDPRQRATVASANSMAAMSGGALGGIALGVLADATTLPTAILAGAALLACAAPLYRRTRPAAAVSRPARPPAPAADRAR